MLIREGDRRTIHVDISLALPLAGVAGAVNAAAFSAVGFFSANMTGNVSSFSDYVAGGNWLVAVTFAGLVAAFVLGSFLSTLLIGIGRHRAIRGVFAYSIAVEGLLLGAVGVADAAVPFVHTTPLLVVSLAFLMGLQNAATTLISNARVRTTHVSGLLTDIGVELALIVGRPGKRADADSLAERFRLHVLTLLAFLAGGVAGVVLYARAGGLVFVLAAAILLALSIPYVFRSRVGAESSLTP